MRLNLIIFIPVLFSCSSSKEHKTVKHEELKKIDWLIGTWENRSDAGVFTESWERENDSVFSGTGSFIENSDTVFSEQLALRYSDGKLQYLPTVSAQNNGKPVPFTMTGLTDSTILFENPSHDFPQKISYRKFSRDSIVAEVSGIAGGKERKEVFPMKRVVN